MSYSKPATPPSQQFEPASPLPKPDWRQWLSNRLTAKAAKTAKTAPQAPQVALAERSSLRNSQLRPQPQADASHFPTSYSHTRVYLPEIHTVKSCSPGIEIAGLNRLDGGWVYSNFTQLR